MAASLLKRALSAGAERLTHAAEAAVRDVGEAAGRAVQDAAGRVARGAALATDPAPPVPDVGADAADVGATVGADAADVGADAAREALRLAGAGVAEALWDEAAAAARRVVAEFRFGNTPGELGLGMALFGGLYALGWLTALQEVGRTPAPGEPPLTWLGLAWALAGAVASLWVLVFVLGAVLLVLDKVAIAALIPSDHAAPLVPIAVRIVFAWCFQPGVLFSLLAAFALTAGLALVWLKALELRRAPAAARARAARHVMTFNLVAVAAGLGAQLWMTVFAA